MTMRPLIVAIDGPSGAGKSTVSKLLARRLGLSFVDTGALYRTVALSARRKGITPDDDAALGALLPGIRISFQAVGEENRVFLDGEDVSREIRTPEISLLASAVSARAVVRDGLLGLQRRLALEAPVGAVLEGRDIGTVVFPDAPLKFFLIAEPGTRVARRASQRGAADQADVEEALRRRDARDARVNPFEPAPDAIVLDTSERTVGDTLDVAIEIVRDRMPELFP